MATAHESIDARLSSIERTLAEIDARLQVLEGTTRPLPAHAEATLFVVPRVAPGTDLAGAATLIGRTFVIVAGAYLLRAMTEAGIVSRMNGAAIGMVYAMAWTVAADRVGARHPLSATFFGACTVLVGFPLLWETTTRFALLPPGASALALAVVTALLLVVAWRRQLHVLAWLATVAACILASLLLVMTGAAVPFAMFLIVLGVATLWLGYDREWTKLRWFAATFADLAVLALIGRTLATPPRDAPAMVIGVQVLLLVGYLGSIAIRTLVRGRDVIVFEAVQTGALLLAGLTGALVIAHRTGVGALALGPCLLVLAASCYAVASAPRWRARSANHVFYTSLGLVFALTGAELALDGAPLSLLWLSLALFAVATGRDDRRRTLAVHAVIYVTAAAISSGLVMAALAGLFASASRPWTSVHAAAWATLAGLAGCWLLSSRGAAPAGNRVDLLRLILAALIVFSVAGVLVSVSRPWLPSSAMEGAILATLRTAIVAAAALAAAWLGRYAAARDFGVLVYPALVWGGLKLLVEDFPTSPPLLLVAALAIYGSALILAPRIARTGRRV